MKIKAQTIIGQLPWSLKTGTYNAPHRVHGYRVKVDLRTRCMAQARGIWPFKRIIIGENYFYLTPREKYGVLLHEAAHCKKFHMEIRLLALPLLLINPDFNIRLSKEQEHQADEFAAREGYGVELLSAINKIKNHSEAGMFYPTYEARVERVNRIINGKT